MSGNWEIVVATVSGFVIAVFTDLIKNWVQRMIEHNRLRDMLYQEILNNHRALQAKVSGLSVSELIIFIKFRLSTEGYEYIKANNIALFYELKEASCFNQLYSICKQLQSFDNKASKEEIEKLLDTLFSMFVFLVENDDLDERRLHKRDPKLKRTVYKFTGSKQNV